MLRYHTSTKNRLRSISVSTLPTKFLFLLSLTFEQVVSSILMQTFSLQRTQTLKKIDIHPEVSNILFYRITAVQDVKNQIVRFI